MKLMCLRDTPTVISKCIAVSKTRMVEVTIRGKKKKEIRHELVYKVKPSREIRVIVGKTGTGHLKFVSAMPHNNRSKPKNKRKTKKRPERRS